MSGKNNTEQFTGGDSRALQELFEQDIHALDSRMKAHRTLAIILAGIIAFILTSIGVASFMFFMNDYHVSLAEMKRDAARFDLIRPGSEYMTLKIRIRKIMYGMRAEMSKVARPYPKRHMMDDDDLESYTSLVYIMSVLEGEDPYGFIANTAVESYFNKKARSHVNAKGVNQVMDYMFDRINISLGKYGEYDIFDVYHNTEAAIYLWLHNRRKLEYHLGRSVSVEELAWAYNAGIPLALRAIKSDDPRVVLPRETWNHGKKVMFYYTNYHAGNYEVYYVSK